jgi:hypothetical protein
MEANRIVSYRASTGNLLREGNIASWCKSKPQQELWVDRSFFQIERGVDFGFDSTFFDVTIECFVIS